MSDIAERTLLNYPARQGLLCVMALQFALLGNSEKKANDICSETRRCT